MIATAVAADSLYIGDQGNSTVQQFDATSGDFIKTLVSSGSGGLDGPFGLVFENSGDLLVANGNLGLPIPGDILRFNGNTGAFEKALANGTGAPLQPNGIVLSEHMIYAANFTGDPTVPGNVSTYNEQTGTFLENLNQNVIPSINYFPRALVYGSEGYLYVAVRDLLNPLGGHVLRFNSNGNFKDVSLTILAVLVN